MPSTLRVTAQRLDAARGGGNALNVRPAEVNEQISGTRADARQTWMRFDAARKKLAAADLNNTAAPWRAWRGAACALLSPPRGACQVAPVAVSAKASQMTRTGVPIETKSNTNSASGIRSRAHPCEAGRAGIAGSAWPSVAGRNRGPTRGPD